MEENMSNELQIIRKYQITVGKEVYQTYTFEVEAASEQEAETKLDDAWGTDELEKMLVGECNEKDYGIHDQRDRFDHVDTILIE